MRDEKFNQKNYTVLCNVKVHEAGLGLADAHASQNDKKTLR